LGGRPVLGGVHGIGFFLGFRRVGILGIGLFRPVLGYRGFRRVGILG
jgi:hypothetical protein